LTKNNDHVTRKIIDNRDGRWECENCQERPDTMAVTMRGGYMQEIVCSQCYTELHPKEPIMVEEGVGNHERSEK